MPNNYYNHGSVPQNNTPGDAQEVAAEFDSVQAGFAKLPTMTGNGGKIVRVNAGGTGLDVSKITITEPATGATLTIADSATLTAPANATVSGTNTGDETAARVAAIVNGVAAKATPVDADVFGYLDSAGAFGLVKATLANIKAALLSAATFTGLVNLAAGANITSAATIDLTAATGNSPRIMGTVATSAVTMNPGQWSLVVADGAWPLTYNATTNKLSGGVSYTCAAGDLVLYHKDLSGIVHGIIFPMGIKSMVRVQGYNGYAATNTVVPRYITVVTNQGTDVTYADSATLGASFTINNSGMYAITAVDSLGGSNFVGISRNTTQPTTNINNLTNAAEVLAISTTVAIDNPIVTSWTGYLAAGDVIRPHESGGPLSTSGAKCSFTIARIG